MPGEQLRVVAIEDDPSDGILLRRHVERIDAWDIDLRIHATAAGGLLELSRGGADVVLLDYQLGGENGLTVLSAIRETNRECPVIFLTGCGDERLAVQAMQAGAADYLPKSALSVNSLTRSLANAVERGRLQRLVKEHRDHLERSNADLERQNREIESFYHTVSHELRTPLTSATEFVRILLDGIAGSLVDEQREYLEIVLQSCQQIAVCLDDLLEATRLETGKLRLQVEETAFDALVRRSVESMSPVARRGEVTLQVTVAPDLPPVLVDRLRIGQVLQNLLGNAIQVSPVGGVVTVEASRSEADGEVRVSVTDRGSGIAEEHRDRIFERLFQVKGDDYDTLGGLGLGLSISRQLVELHGGRITVDSRVGEGSNFTITVPAVTARQPEPLPETLPPA